MPVRALTLVVLLTLVAFTLVACNQQSEPQAATEGGSQAITDTGGQAITEGGQAVVGQETAGQQATQTGAEEESGTETEGMISSGQDEPLPESNATEPVRPTPEEGIQRFVTIEDAQAALPFPLHVPTELPENSDLTMVQLIEPIEGQTVTDLPAARLVYDIDMQGVLVVRQSPATGQPGTGEEVSIGDNPGWLDELSAGPDNAVTLIIVWEQDGIRYDMRGRNLDRETMLTAAASMAPYSAEG